MDIDKLRYIDALNDYLRKENHEQKEKNFIDEAKLEAIKTLNIDPHELEELSDSEKEMILQTISLLDENKELKEQNKKINKDIDAYTKKIKKSSHITNMKIKQKIKKREDI